MGRRPVSRRSTGKGIRRPGLPSPTKRHAPEPRFRYREDSRPGTRVARMKRRCPDQPRPLDPALPADSPTMHQLFYYLTRQALLGAAAAGTCVAAVRLLVLYLLW